MLSALSENLDQRRWASLLNLSDCLFFRFLFRGTFRHFFVAREMQRKQVRAPYSCGSQISAIVKQIYAV